MGRGRASVRIDCGGLGLGAREPAAERVEREAKSATELGLGQAAAPPLADEAGPINDL
jgi:hypothetical protein